jgi:membrane protein YqaA with SNARE-associated domain
MSSFSRWIIALFATPIGVIVLAALDSTVFFSMPLGIDVAVVLVAARRRELAWIIPILATAGSVAGALLTFWMGKKIGEKGLEQYVPRRRLEHVRRRVRDTGAITLAVLDLVPPPFPFTPFVLAAGALEVRSSKFFVTLAVCRIARFGAESLLAVRYGRQIVAWLQSDTVHDVVGACIVLAFVASAISVFRLLRTRRVVSRRSAA